MSQAYALHSRRFGFERRGLVRIMYAARRCFFRMAGWRQTACFLFLCLATVVTYASAQTERTPPNLKMILFRMAQARAENRARLRPYTVTRDYKLFGKEKDRTKAQVVADVAFVPPNSKQYAIEQADGTGLGERIVRRMLESEAAAAKDYRATDYSTDNYDFRFLREEILSGQHCYVLEMVAKRKEEILLRGTIWVDATTYLIHLVDAGPAKNPSWWLRDVRIVLSYSDVQGMWLQTASESTAKVRILGQHTMESRDVNYEIGHLVASESSPINSLSKHTPDESLRDLVIQVHQSNLLVGNKEWPWNLERPFALQQINPGKPVEGKRRMF
jgi:hypothetical protein